MAGRARRPAGDEAAAARAAHLAGVPSAELYADFSDFSLWVLGVERVRWVGGYGRMASADAGDYAAAEPDPVAPAAAGAIAHLNADHADALLAMALAFTGYADATAATCTGADRYGLDLMLEHPARPRPGARGLRRADHVTRRPTRGDGRARPPRARLNRWGCGASHSPGRASCASPLRPTGIRWGVWRIALAWQGLVRPTPRTEPPRHPHGTSISRA